MVLHPIRDKQATIIFFDRALDRNIWLSIFVLQHYYETKLSLLNIGINLHKLMQAYENIK